MGSEGTTQMHQTPPPGHMQLDASESLALVAYRLGELEKVVGTMNGKFDKVADLYVNHASLVLILEPIKTAVRELQDHNKEEEKSKNQASSQLKLAIIVAITSPIVSAVVTILIGTAVVK